MNKRERPKSAARRLDRRPSACRRLARSSRNISGPPSTKALAAHRTEIDAIAADPAAPTFANTIEALERGGRALDRVSNVFFVLAGADTNDAIEAIERDISPLLARHSNALYLDRALFARIASSL